MTDDIIIKIHVCEIDEFDTWRCEHRRATVSNEHPVEVMSYAFRQGDLPKLDLQVDRGTDFKAWKSQYTEYYD